MPISQKPFGITADGRKVNIFMISNSNGAEVELLDYGATIQSWRIPDKIGKVRDIVLGFDNIEDYEKDKAYLGCVVGRVCNRINSGKFTLDGVNYEVAVNNGPNHLHGGIHGFNRKVWKAEIKGNSLVFSYDSPDGEEGYPGNLKVSVVYTLTDSNELKLEYRATTDKPTIVNLTNHVYFNLAGEGSKNLGDQEISILCDARMTGDKNCLATGTILAVKNTAYDVRKSINIREAIINVGETSCGCPGGFDTNYCIDNANKSVKLVSVARSASTGITLETSTDQPGIQFYTANWVDFNGKAGKYYGKHSGFCLEAQIYPDAINHPEYAQTSILRPGDVYTQTTVYKCQA